ncbi:TPM domain-containing protein [Rufibacter immobilis]|uniref:TPM domain-containing protein n=1 Tax=Rufibacter immobilis TaxID=1348778 RepID=UPI0035E471D1
MKSTKVIALLILTISSLSLGCTAPETEGQSQLKQLVSSESNERKFPRPVGYVNDFENILTPEQVEALNKILVDYKQKTTNEIAVVTVPSIAPYSDFDEYALELSKEWGVGEKGKNNGLTIVFSKTLTRVRISTGLGTEKILTDEVCQRVVDQIMVPNFQKGKLYEGISLGTAELIKLWQ